MPRNEDVCYLAGVIDGEGWIGITYETRNQRYLLELSVVSTDKPLIQWLNERFGGRAREEKQRKERWSQPHRVCWWNEGAKRVLKLVSPYLIIKKKQAELALEFPTPRSRPGHMLPYWAQKKREELHREISRLNKKGPSSMKLCKEAPDVWRQLGLKGKCNCMP